MYRVSQKIKCIEYIQRRLIYLSSSLIFYLHQYFIRRASKWERTPISSYYERHNLIQLKLIVYFSAGGFWSKSHKNYQLVKTVIYRRQNINKLSSHVFCVWTRVCGKKEIFVWRKKEKWVLYPRIILQCE